jgi:hypothetical protein
MSREFEISRLLEMTENKKYATTVAAFRIIDHLEQIDFPKKIQNRKPAVQAMHALSDKLINWDYISEEARRELEEELKASRRTRSALDEVFAAPGSIAPVSVDSEEELEEIGETAPLDVFSGEEDEFAEEEEEEEESEEEEEESEDNDDDDDDDFDDSDDDEKEVLEDD